MERPTAQVMEALEEMEQAAEEILSEKETSIQLDKRRHQTREALRTLQKDKTDKKVDLCFGNLFIKMPKHKAKALLEKDHEQLDDEIDGIRKSLKVKVNKLRDIEGKEELKGFDLKAIPKEDLAAIKELF